MVLLAKVQLDPNNADKFVWKGNVSKSFTVSSCYRIFQNLDETSELEITLKTVLDLIWKTKIPLKARIFSWRLVFDRLPTRSNLAARGLISNIHEIACVLCFNVVEDSNHLFITCPHSK
ncbi:unnamed protein product [Lathyrus sativus]|nr:unnamed protein product [Lathyrus sativus]